MKYFIYGEDGFGWFIFPKENENPPENTIHILEDCNFIKPRYNFLTKELEEGLSQEEKDIERQAKIKELNLLQRKELEETDWYFTRFLWKGVEVPQEIIKKRESIYEKYNQLKQEL